jgi:hypothetical protein
VKRSVNTQPVGNGLEGSVDWEHGNKIHLIVPAPATHPVTQGGHDILLSMYKEININNPLVHVQITGQKD